MKKNKIHQNVIFLFFITILLIVVTQASGVGSNHVERAAKVKQLIEVAGTRSPSRPVPEEIQKETDEVIRDKYFAERSRQFQEEEDKREQARNELAAMGDEIIDQLVEIYNDNRYKMHIAIVLKKIGSQKAKETLFNMALGQNGFNWTYSTAARHYLGLTNDKEEIKPLLVSNVGDILSMALRDIAGVKVDAELLKRLDEILQSARYLPATNRILRMYALGVIAADTSNEFMEEKIAAIVKSIQTVEKIQRANERFSLTETGTFADSMYSQISHTLRRMKDKNIDNYLTEATGTLTGNPRRWVLTTRARLGDATVKNEIKEILEDPNMLERTRLRSSAIVGLKKIGTAEDIPFLRNIAETDPVYLLRRTDMISGPILEMIDDKPVNNTGERVVDYDEYSIPDWLNNSIREYFIRNQAESAIETIEKSIKGK